VKEIKYRETGNELIALLLEDHEIRHYWPAGNHAQKHRINRFGIARFPDRNGRLRMAVTKGARSTCTSEMFHQYHLAMEYISEMVKKYNLDPNFCGIPSDSGIDLETHNLNFNLMLDTKRKLSVLTEVYFLEGRSENERSYILLENGFYKGFGFIENDNSEKPCKLYRNLSLRYSSVTTENIIRNLVQTISPAMSFQKDNNQINFHETVHFNQVKFHELV
jgi:DNA polymerase-3 subunit epsilon